MDLFIDFFPDRIKTKDSEGKTALHNCVIQNYLYGLRKIANSKLIAIDVIKLLLLSADKKIKNKDGFTAYDLAKTENQLDVVKLFEG